MPNDAMIVGIDEIRFTYPKAKKMRVYAVGIAADNTGKVLVTEPPASAHIRHRPKIGRPAVWDFGGDGYMVYQKTGGLADLIAAHLLIVRDRSATRRAGDIVKAVSESDAANKAMKVASQSLNGLSIGGMAAANAVSMVLPLAGIVGDIISKKKDKVLQTISGSLFLDEERKALDELSEKITAPDGNMEVFVDAFLFDADIDEDSEADTKTAETRLQADGLLFSSDQIE
jgi:hypothetical protein